MGTSCTWTPPWCRMWLLESALAPAWAIRLLQCWVCQVCRLCQVCQRPAQPCSHHRGLENLVPTSSAKKGISSILRSHQSVNL